MMEELEDLIAELRDGVEKISDLTPGMTLEGTITNVNSVTNQSNIGGIQAQLLVNGQNLSAWQACVRARIT